MVAMQFFSEQAEEAPGGKAQQAEEPAAGNYEASKDKVTTCRPHRQRKKKRQKQPSRKKVEEVNTDTPYTGRKTSSHC